MSCQGLCLGTWVSQVLTGEPSLIFDLAGWSQPHACIWGSLDHFYSTSLHPLHVQHSLNWLGNMNRDTVSKLAFKHGLGRASCAALRPVHYGLCTPKGPCDSLRKLSHEQGWPAQSQHPTEDVLPAQSWGSVYYFCGDELQYCKCNLRWNLAGWAKACFLWNFVLGAALGWQKLIIQVGLDGLLAGATIPPIAPDL